MTAAPHQNSGVETTAEERAELIALLERNATNHEAYRACMGTKGERRAKAEWKRSCDWLEVHAVGYLRKLVDDVNGLIAERTDPTTAAKTLRDANLITPEQYNRICARVGARDVFRGEGV